MADQATLQARLDQAEAALHELIMGEKPVSLSYADSKSATFNKAEIGQLRAYIADLKRQLGQPSGRSAIGVRFA